MIHSTEHPKAGEKVILKTGEMRVGTDPDELNGREFVIEDWWDRVGGQSWMHMNGNPACMKYGMRSGLSGLPCDNEVVYGKVGCFGHLIHNSELGEPTEPESEGRTK